MDRRPGAGKNTTTTASPIGCLQQALNVSRPDESGAVPESIEELFSSLESPLLAYARRLTASAETAEDLVQESFMRLHSQFAEVREPRRWLYRTLHNLAVNQLRRDSRSIPLDPRPADPNTDPSPDTHLPQSDPESLPDAQIIRLEGIGLVHLSLATLDPRSREVVRLKFEEDLSYQQIADRTGLGTGNVGYILHHALKSLGAELARTGLVP